MELESHNYMKWIIILYCKVSDMPATSYNCIWRLAKRCLDRRNNIVSCVLVLLGQSAASLIVILMNNGFFRAFVAACAS